MHFTDEIKHSVCYLQSDEARRTLDADVYWPKWDSPWWHMLLLHEMGNTSLIPQQMIDQCVNKLDRMPLKIFPLHAEDILPGVDPVRETLCHCQLGNVYQILASRGVDVDTALPWIRPWFFRYQMADGGLNCNHDAYLINDECPSSMVGTIAAFEAILLYTPREWTLEERRFLDRAARFLIERELRLGSTSKHNAAERISAGSWAKLCFPRFYFYDVLRGLSALLLWAEKTQNRLPVVAIQSVVDGIALEYPHGAVRIGRRAFEGVKTTKQSSTGQWLRRQEAASFPLLDAVSVVGTDSPYLSRQWTDAKRRIATHVGCGLDAETTAANL